MMITARLGISASDRVLDVACGTGIVARTAADLLGSEGAVTGVDLNEAMLTVARRVRPGIEWKQGDAQDLPFDEGSFNAVLCQMALMFVPDRERAVDELARVASDGGVVGVVVPSDLGSQPAYRPFVDAAVRHAGPEAESLLGAYWSCGDVTALIALFEGAGLRDIRAETHMGTVRFASPDEMVATEVEGSPLRERITDEVYERILEDAREVLDPFTTTGGEVEAPLEAHMVVARKG
jgi:SAM-dependent methyltransferase